MPRNTSRLIATAAILIAFMVLPYALVWITPMPIAPNNFEQDVRLIVQDELVKQGLIVKPPVRLPE